LPDSKIGSNAVFDPGQHRVEQSEMALIESKREKRSQQINIRLGEKHRKQLDRFAKRKHWTRTRAVRWMIENLPLAKQEVG
jgi:hypothetical protein